MTARVLLVEDHPLVRDGLRALLEPAGFKVCGEADNPANALAALGTSAPDLLLVDLTLHGQSGLDLLRDLPAGAPPVVVYSMHEDWLHIRLALQCGARGYVTKRELSEVLLETLHTVLDGKTYLSNRALRTLDETGSECNLKGIDTCSSQEMVILHLLGRGMGVGDVADTMDISRKTVESYCSRLQVKLNLRGMKELRGLALGAFSQA